MYIISLHSQTHISSYKTVSSTISLFQRNNLPNTKIRSEKTFFPPANFLFIHPFKSLLKLPPFPSPGNKRQTWTREKTSLTGNLRFRFDDTPPRIYGGRFAWTGWKIRFHVVSSNYVDSIRGWRIVLFPRQILPDGFLPTVPSSNGSGFSPFSYN